MTDKYSGEKFKEKQEICLLSKCFSERYFLITEGKVLMVQKLHRYHVNQVSNVHINICKTQQHHECLDTVNWQDLTVGKHQANTDRRTVYKITGQRSSKLSKSLKRK